MSIDSASSQLSLEAILGKISEITLQIQRCRNLEELLQWVVADVRALLQTDRVVIYRCLEGQEAVVAFESVGAEWTPILGQFIPDPCLHTAWNERYSQRQVSALSDIHARTVAPCYRQLLKQLQVQASLVVPIVNQGSPWGLLIAHHCRSPREWHPLEIQLLQHVALHLELAIQQAESQQHQQRLESQLEQYAIAAQQESEKRQQLLRVEEELRQQQEILQTIFDHLPIMIGLYSPTGEILMINRELEQVIGWTKAEYQTTDVLRACYPDPADYAGVLAHIITADSTWKDFKTQVRDGRILDTSWAQIRLSDGRSIGIGQDITERKRVETALRQSEAHYRLITELTSDYIYRLEVDASGAIGKTTITDQFTPLNGFSLSGTQELTAWHQSIHPDDIPAALQFFQTVLASKQTGSIELRLLNQNGSPLWVNVYARPEFAAAGDTITAIEGAVKDITDRKQKEDLIQNIVQGVSAETGEAFFYSLVQYLIRLLNMDQAFVGELVAPEQKRVKVIAGSSHSQPLDGVEYDLTGTPCELTLETGLCIYPDRIQQRFPDDPMLPALGGEGYACISLKNAAGTVIGLMGVISNQPIDNIQLIQEVLTIFAVRAASELERQQSERLLRRYERIVSATPDCVSMLDRNYVYQVVNQTYLSWNQKSYEEIVGHSVSDLLGQAFFETYSQPLLDRCLAGEPKQSFKLWQNYPDGQQRYIKATYTPYLEADGTVSGVVVNVHDLTDLKRTEEALRESEERFQEIANTISQMFFVRSLNPDRYVYISPSYEKIWGRPLEELLQNPQVWMEAIHPDDRQQVEASLKSQFQGNHVRREYRIVRPDGAIRWITAEIAVIRDASGQPIRFIGLAEDISDRKAAEAALLEQQRFTEQVAESTLAILYVYDLIEQRNIYSNQQIEAVLGYSPEEVRAMGNALFSLLLHPDDLSHVILKQQELAGVRDDEFMEVEYRMRHKDGSYRWLLSRDRVFRRTADGLPKQSLGVATDITILKETQAALHQQAEQQRLLTAIAQHIRQTLDLDHILHTTVTEVRQFLQTDRVIIYRFNPDWSGTIIAESVAAGWRSILGMQITDTYFLTHQGNGYQQGCIKQTNDIYTGNLDPCHIALLEQMQVRAKLIVPILQDNQLWGLLVAQHCRSPRQWEAAEIELQQQLATQIAIAIQQSELYRQVQTLNTSLELQVQERTTQLQQALEFESLLKRITDHVRDSLDEEQILQTAVRELAQGLSTVACDTGIYNAEQTISTIAYEFTNGLTPVHGRTFEMSAATHADVYPQLLSGQICLFCDIAPSPFRPDQQFLNILAVPIVDDQGALGDLWLFKRRQDEFNDLEVRLVQQVANQCAIALRQSRLYQTAQAQVKELEQLNQLKDDFLSTVSHELRSPMSNIKMATQMLEINLSQMGMLNDESDAINRYFKILREEGKREVNLINDLLDLARLDAGTEPLNFTTIALQFYIPHLTEPLIERTQQQQQQFSIQIPDDLPPITTDLPYLERILTELLHNACKYTPAGETITISAQTLAEGIEIRVSNSGVEIPAAECERVFDKFYRIPNSDPWKHGGTGLGLALVRKLAERLGGSIHAESGGGQTSFILELKAWI